MNPVAVQNALIGHIIRKNIPTAFGKRYGFSRLRTPSDFQKAVPVSKYEDLEPFALKTIYSCPYEVYEIKDYDARYYAILRIAAGHSLSGIYSVNPSTLVLLAKRLSEHTESIIRDVRDGTFSREFERLIRETSTQSP
jgi:hypothetical protein